MNRKTFLLLNSDPVEGNGPEAKPEGTPPPMSHIAVTGQKTEREIELETLLDKARKETEDERIARVDRERTICEMQDKHENYRKSVETPKPAPRRFNIPTVLD